MSENNQIMSMEGQLCGMPLAGPESFSQQQLDYLKRALGVDETVLYNAPVGTAPIRSITLSEDAFHFERLRIVYGLDSNVISDSNPNYTTESEFYLRPTISKYQIGATVYNWSSGNPLQIWGAGLTISGSSIEVTIALRRWWNQNASDTLAPYIYKVVGIHRIAGGN